jgi:hypothetical protein
VLDDGDPNLGAPDPPQNFSVCIGGNPDCNDVAGEPASSGTAVLRWNPPAVEDPDGIEFYRVYRDSTAYGARIGVLFPVLDSTGAPVVPQVFIDTSASGSHTYYVSTVDGLFGESVPTEGEEWPP